MDAILANLIVKVFKISKGRITNFRRRRSWRSWSDGGLMLLTEWTLMSREHLAQFELASTKHSLAAGLGTSQETKNYAGRRGVGLGVDHRELVLEITLLQTLEQYLSNPKPQTRSTYETDSIVSVSKSAHLIF
jgi:hypothetical protein